MTLAEWILAAALAFASPETRPQYDGHVETVDQTRARYVSIAEDIAATVGEGKNAHDHAALLLALAIGESGLAHDADVGPCYRGKDKRSPLRLRCDSGHAATVWQLHELAGHSLADLFADRRLAARIVLRLAVGSFGQCKALAPEDQLSGMGLGHCEAGNASVRARFALYRRIQNWSPAK